MKDFQRWYKCSVLIFVVIVLLPCTFQYSELCTENEDLYCTQLMTEQMEQCVYIPLHISFQDAGETKLQQFSVLIHMNCYDLDLTSVPKVMCQVPSHHPVVKLGCVGIFIGGIRFENIWTWPWSGYRTQPISVSLCLCPPPPLSFLTTRLWALSSHTVQLPWCSFCGPKHNRASNRRALRPWAQTNLSPF